MQNKVTAQQAMAKAAGLFDAGQFSQAETLCRSILQVQPQFHPAWYQLGLIAVKAGNMPVAADMMARAVQFAPNASAYHRALGEICRRLGNLQKAIAHGKQAAALAPQDPEARYNLGLALADSGQFYDATSLYRVALELNPRHNLAANNLGTALERLGDEKSAADCYARAININPRHAEAQNNLGALLLAAGDLDRARACFESAIAADPAFVHPHYNLSSLKKYTSGDPHAAILETIARQSPALPPDTRMRFWFAIGKAREDTGRYDDAFAAYAEGNALKRATFKYDETTLTAAVDDIIRRFDGALAAKIGSVGHRDQAPLFIVGMPRSGTTLIEQILSSHTDLHGAGELKDFSDAFHTVHAGPPEISYMDFLLKAPDEDLARIGADYTRRLRQLDGKALRISDKMPGNFFYAGLICLSLPKAKIVHSLRHPLDTCLSNYARLFNETMPFAYDLGELGRYYLQYKRLMDHWHKILPAGKILDMHYEDVVGDLAGQAKRLISHTGLEWQDGCLDFHKNTRPVKTASVAQVRKPIYKSSVSRWEYFARHLEPLKTIIEGQGQ